MIKFLVAQLGNHLSEYFASKDCYNVSPSLAAVCMGHREMIFPNEVVNLHHLVFYLSPIQSTEVLFGKQVDLSHVGLFNNQMVCSQKLPTHEKPGYLSSSGKCSPIYRSLRNCNNFLAFISQPFKNKVWSPLLSIVSVDLWQRFNSIEYQASYNSLLPRQLNSLLSRQLLYQVKKLGHLTAKLSLHWYARACCRGMIEVAEFIVKESILSGEDVINGVFTAIGFGQLEMACQILMLSPNIINYYMVTFGMDFKDIEKKLAHLDWNVVECIFLYSWADIIKLFAQPTTVRYSRLTLADAWLAHKFGKHQIDFLRHRLKEEPHKVECITVQLVSNTSLELTIDWVSFREAFSHYSSSSHGSADTPNIADIPLSFYAYVVSSVLGQLRPFCPTASLSLPDLFNTDVFSIQSLLISCVQSPIQPCSQLNGSSATLVVSYLPETRQFTFPQDQALKNDSTVVKCTKPASAHESTQPLYTQTVPDQLSTLSNQMQPWAVVRQCPTKMKFSADFYQLDSRLFALVAPCVSMVISDIQSLLELARYPVALYAEADRIPCWFRNVYLTLAHWLTPRKVFTDLFIDFVLGYNKGGVAIKLMEDEKEKTILVFQVTLVCKEDLADCLVPSHMTILRKLSDCLFSVEMNALRHQTQSFFNQCTGTDSSVNVSVLLEDKGESVTPLWATDINHIFLLKLCPLFVRAVRMIMKQQHHLCRHSSFSSTEPSSLSLRITLSFASKSSHVNFLLPSVTLSLWELIHDGKFHSPTILQFFFLTKGITLQSISHLPCAMLSSIDPASISRLPYVTHNQASNVKLCLRNIANFPITGEELNGLLELKVSRKRTWCSSWKPAQSTCGGQSPINYLQSQSNYTRVTVSVCGHPLSGSPFVTKTPITNSSTSTPACGYEETVIPHPIMVIVGHLGGECVWWKKRQLLKQMPSYLKCLSVVKNCKWIVVSPTTKGPCGVNVAMFVGLKKTLNHKAITNSNLRVEMVPVNRTLAQLSLYCDRSMLLHVASFCTKCHTLLEMYWKHETMHLPRSCLFHPDIVPSAEFSTVTLTCPETVTTFSRRQRRKVLILESTAGKQLQFYMIPRDQYGNLIDLTTANLEATLSLLVPSGGQLQQEHQEGFPRSITSFKNKDSWQAAHCQFTRHSVGKQPILKCSCTLYHAGNHLLCFETNGESTSVARINVQAHSRPHPAHCAFSFKKSTKTVYVLTKWSCSVLTYDSFYNPVAGIAGLEAAVVGPSASLNCTIKCHSHSRQAKEISFRLVDFNFTHLHVTVDGVHIIGSPLPIYVVKSKPILEVPFKERLSELHKSLTQSYEQGLSLTVLIDRSDILHDAVSEFLPSYFHRKLRVRFMNELGIDVGGVAREFYLLLCQEFVNPNYALFECVEGGFYKPSPNSSVNPEHLFYFEFFGKILGKMISSKCSTNVRFTPAVYKVLTGEENEYEILQIVLDDLMFENAVLSRSLKHILECQDQDQLNDLTEHFTAQLAEFGSVKTVELEKGGTGKKVTVDNKEGYVHKVALFYLTGCIAPQLQSMQNGLHQMVTAEQLNNFMASELEEIMCGSSSIDLTYMKQKTTYSGYNEMSNVIVWLWKILESFTEDERRCFLQFCTGSATLPCFDSWSLMITRAMSDSSHLPSASTCFNTLSLPAYSSSKQLEAKLRKAIQMGQEFHTY